MAGSCLGGRGLVALTGLLVACGALVLSGGALAATYVPNKTGDHPPNGCTHTDCTLREAITKANNHPGRDTIVLRGGKTYNLFLMNTAGSEDLNATGDLDVLGALNLESSNKKLAAIDANGIDRVFEVGTGTPVSATFRRVTIRGGDASGSLGHGGGIDSEYGGALKLIRSRVVANRTDAEGGGIAADGGTLQLVRSVIAHNDATNPFQNAGGIEGEPGATENEVISVSRSRIVDNHAGGAGGGIYGYNRVTITKSTIANNRADTGVGGGIFNANGTLIVRSSTLSGNTTGNDGGAIENYGTATLVNDTITKNQASGLGGGVESDSSDPATLNAVTVARNTAGTGGGIEGTPITVRNSLIALNSSTGQGPDCRPAPTIVSGGHNLIGDTTDCTGIFGPATHDFTDLNPRIAQLANNGGPTKTIALRRHSKAINHAGSDAPKRDQRGVKRHDPDIGAFERR
jgi:fibronectin-binding autotransporter adhesin